MATTIELSSDTALRVTLAASFASLFLSGWAFMASIDDDGSQRDVERRLACLELPGPNDCGTDGR
jgi:hypothetical protein